MGVGAGGQTPGRGGGASGGLEMSEYAGEWRERMGVGSLEDVKVCGYWEVMGVVVLGS